MSGRDAHKERKSAAESMPLTFYYDWRKALGVAPLRRFGRIALFRLHAIDSRSLHHVRGFAVFLVTHGVDLLFVSFDLFRVGKLLVAHVALHHMTSLNEV